GQLTGSRDRDRSHGERARRREWGASDQEDGRHGDRTGRRELRLLRYAELGYRSGERRLHPATRRDPERAGPTRGRRGELMPPKRQADVDPGFENLLNYLKATRGFDFTGYKRPSLMRRVQKRLGDVKIGSFADYIDYLEVHP